MSGEVLAVTTPVSAAAVAVLPSTGSTRPLFIAAAVLLVGGLVAMALSFVAARKSNG